MSKVYTGDRPFSDHVQDLVNLYGMNPEAVNKRTRQKKEPDRKQSIQIRKLKREAGIE